MRGLSAGPFGQKVTTTPPTAGQPTDVAFLVPEACQKMNVQAEEKSSASFPLVVRVLLLQLGLSVVIGALFWGFSGTISAYSAVLGGLTCVLPNAFLALRLVVPRSDPGAGALIRAAYVGEVGKLALTVIMFTLVFTLVTPLTAGALFTGFIAAQLATFVGFLMRDRAEHEIGNNE